MTPPQQQSQPICQLVNKKREKSLQRSIYFVSGRFCPRWQTRKQSISAPFQRCKRSKTKNWPRKQHLNGLPCQWEHTAPESVSRRLVRTLAFKVVESRALSADCSAKGRTPLYLTVLGTASQVAQFWWLLVASASLRPSEGWTGSFALFRSATPVAWECRTLAFGLETCKLPAKSY